VAAEVPPLMELSLPASYGKRPAANSQLPPSKWSQPAKAGAPAKGARASSSAKTATNMADQDELETLLALGELSLESAAGTREALSLLQYTVMMPAECLGATEGLEGGKEYAEEAKRRKGENIGSAHTRIALKTLMGFSNMDQFKNNPTFCQTLKDFWSTYVEKLSPQDLEEYIMTWRMVKPKISSKTVLGGKPYVKLILKLRPASPSQDLAAKLQEAILQVARDSKWEVKVGAPPRSQKERKVLDIVQALRSQIGE
jgi:hypothetical protein